MPLGTINIWDTINRAATLLNDPNFVQWGVDELLDWINEGQRQIVLLRPDANSDVKQITLVAGVRQSMPVSSIRLLDILGNVNGRACTYVERSTMNSYDPTWRVTTADPTVIHWMYDERLPQEFQVYPPQPTSGFGKVEIVRSVMPTDCTAKDVDGGTSDSTIGIPDQYEPALVDYCVYRSYSKDAEYTVRGGKADLAWNHFLQTLGIQLQTDRRYGPRNNAPPHRSSQVPSQGASP